MLATVLYSRQAFSENIGGRLTGMLSDFASLGNMIAFLMLLVGLAVTGLGLYKFYSWRVAPNDPANRPSLAALYLLAGGLLAVPFSVLTVGSDTFFEFGERQSASPQKLRINEFDNPGSGSLHGE